MAKKENTASILAFEKKIVPSDGYMYGTNWNERDNITPLALKEKSVRGTISNRLKPVIKNDPQKLNAEVEKPNLQRVDACALEPHQDTLKLHFTLKILGGVIKPSACNNPGFKKSYELAAKSYIADQGFSELAKRYAINIANARFLWRNRFGADTIEVNVTATNKTTNQNWVFDATEFNLQNFDTSDKNIDEMATLIAQALASDDNYLLLSIDCYVKMGKAQEVYPSEELVLDKGKGEKSKILYQVNNIAAMHSQKIGNAIRSIDTWYPDFKDSEQSAGPIAIEPYGAVTNLGHAFRTPKDNQDFYTLFDRWARGEKLDDINDQHYVMAVLIRGGVFGESDKE